MKHYRLLFYIIFTALIHNAAHAEGFIANTIVTASKGNTFISHIKPKDFVIVNNNNNCCRKHKNYSRVQRIHQYVADKCIKITIDDTAICCAPNQKFYCVKNNRWIEAQYLTHDNHLICADSSTVTVDKIEFINKPTTVYALTVKKHHIYCIEPHKIIAHNYGEPLMSAPFIIASSVSTAASAACSTIAAIFSIPAAPALLTVGSAASVIIAGAAIYFAQKQKQRNLTFTEIQADLHNATNGGSPKKPNKNNKNDDDDEKNNNSLDNDDEEKYPYGKYEDVDYHPPEEIIKNKCKKRNNSYNLHKSPRPKNGQLCLNNSLKSISNQRIAVEGDTFVVLMQTRPQLYHGYKVPWEKLHRNIRDILKEAGITSPNGKILKQITRKIL